MPKVVLEFNLPEEQDELEAAQNGAKYKHQLDDVWEQIFRPAFKHGYSDPELENLASSKNGRRLIELLKNIYLDITREN